MIDQNNTFLFNSALLLDGFYTNLLPIELNLNRQLISQRGD